ncbi:MarC family protein [Alteromonas sp. S015]|uniref:MarC family protein n=1 Tax=Alteromonas sp. S015 TaxID=3117401 RepID=UPI002FE22C1C
MNYSAAGWQYIVVTILAFASLCAITFICFISSSRTIRLIGDSGLSIVTRLMGLILAVIGVQTAIAEVSSVVTSFLS